MCIQKVFIIFIFILGAGVSMNGFAGETRWDDEGAEGSGEPKEGLEGTRQRMRMHSRRGLASHPPAPANPVNLEGSVHFLEMRRAQRQAREAAAGQPVAKAVRVGQYAADRVDPALLARAKADRARAAAGGGGDGSSVMPGEIREVSSSGTMIVYENPSATVSSSREGDGSTSGTDELSRDSKSPTE